MIVAFEQNIQKWISLSIIVHFSIISLRIIVLVVCIIIENN